MMPDPETESTSKYDFTRDWFSMRTGSWSKHFGFLAQRETFALEVGSLEGRSAVWTLENLLSHSSSRLTCIDPFPHPPIEQRFDENLRVSGYGHKVTKLKGESWEHLRTLEPRTFDFIYIDGSHYGRDVLEDGVLSYRLLKSGGFLVFDDYPWRGNPEFATFPKDGIDAFLALYGGSFSVLEKQWQVILQRTD